VFETYHNQTGREFFFTELKDYKSILLLENYQQKLFFSYAISPKSKQIYPIKTCTYMGLDFLKLRSSIKQMVFPGERQV